MEKLLLKLVTFLLLLNIEEGKMDQFNESSTKQIVKLEKTNK